MRPQTDADARERGDLLPCEVDRLHFRVRETPIVDGVSLRLDGGGVTVIMGPNGAGKSVLIRLLHGLLEPTSGRVTWGGRPLDRNVRRRQAMVFQRPVLLRRSVAANLRFVLGPAARRDPQRLERLLRHAGLLARASQPARRLSGGEQQRLALARALALEPQVLFLDEPTASLDPASTITIEALVREANADGTTIVLVTHDIGQARRLADDVVFLHHGRVLEHTPAALFFDRPRSAAARDFLSGRLII